MKLLHAGRITFVLTIACLFASGCGVEAPTKADAVTLQTMNYADVEKLIESYRGQVVVMDAWSTSCDPCIKEFPNLVALSKKHPGKVACISLSLDYEGLGKPDELHPKVLEFLHDQGATFKNVLAGEDSDAMLKHLGIASIPAVFVYDRQGKKVATFDKPGFTYRDVEQRARELLDAQ
jgi:thiol-disulfide isomerase/thioredoxin